MKFRWQDIVLLFIIVPSCFLFFKSEKKGVYLTGVRLIEKDIIPGVKGWGFVEVSVENLESPLNCTFYSKLYQDKHLKYVNETRKLVPAGESKYLFKILIPKGHNEVKTSVECS